MRFKVFLLTKDEYDLLEDYVTYYARMFDYDSIVIVDNMSTHPRVLELYHRYAELGVHIHYEPQSFRLALNFMTKYMKMYAHTCDWMIPAETDEFLFGRSTLEPLPHEDPPWTITAITEPERWAGRAQLETFLDTVTESAVLFKRVYISCPDRDEYEYPAREITRFKPDHPNVVKFMVRSSAFRKIIIWEHLAETFPDTKHVTDKFSYLHFHDTGLKRRFEKSLSIIRSFSLVDLGAPIEEQICVGESRLGMSLEAGHKINIYLEGIKKGFRASNEPSFYFGVEQMLKLKALPWMKIKYVLDPSGHGVDFFSRQGSHVQVSGSPEPSRLYDLIYIHRCTKKDLVDCVSISHPSTFLVVDNIVYKPEHANAGTWEPTRAWKELINILLIEELEHIDIADGQGMSIGRYTGF